MNNMNRRAWLSMAVAAAAGVSWESAFAQPAAYPNRPVTLIVPFPAGGVTDVVARELAEGMSKALGQPFVVENKAGAAGNLGTQAVARAKPDGYTLGVLTVSSMSISPHVYKSPGFNPATDFAPITQLVRSPGIVLARGDAPYNTLQELLAYARKNPGKVTYASVGVGSIPHLTAEMFAQSAGIRLTHIPYKGAAPAMQDLIGGFVDVSFETSVVTAVQSLPGGRIKALAITGPERVGVLPEVPTVAEAGLPGFSVQGWFGLFAPAGVPPAVLAQLNAAAVAILANPATVQRLAKAGLLASPSSSVEFAGFVQQDSAAWGRIVRERKLELQ
jgi:tripartite-type tricarboxylate transporter receptor subunit TctC